MKNDNLNNMQKIVTRFAPSPTGYLHIGSARTALYNYLFAKANKGKFLLRIEDTDEGRLKENAIEAIFSSLKWLEIEPDEEAIFQSKRNDLYLDAALDLIEKGKAYYCFASQEEIEKQRSRALQQKQNFIFQSPWRDKDKSSYPSDIKPVIRLKIPRNNEEILTIKDELQGNIAVQYASLDDMVLVRSNGKATYMLAVVVDDYLTKITHIIRGDDHLTNAARQIALYQAFNWQVPSMVHIPMIHGLDGSKLSKRHGALGVEEYKEMGFLPEALCNYLLRLGFSHGDDEIISRENAIKWFNFNSLGKSPARLDFAKMCNVNAYYLRNMEEEKLAKEIFNILEKNHDIDIKEKDYICKAIASLKLRCRLINELAEMAKIFLFSYKINFEAEAIKIIQEKRNLIDEIYIFLENIDNKRLYVKEEVQNLFKNFASTKQYKLNEIMLPLRIALTGKTDSISVFEIISIVGKDNILKRLKEL